MIALDRTSECTTTSVDILFYPIIDLKTKGTKCLSILIPYLSTSHLNNNFIVEAFGNMKVKVIHIPFATSV